MQLFAVIWVLMSVQHLHITVCCRGPTCTNQQSHDEAVCFIFTWKYTLVKGILAKVVGLQCCTFRCFGFVRDHLQVTPLIQEVEAHNRTLVLHYKTCIVQSITSEVTKNSIYRSLPLIWSKRPLSLQVLAQVSSTCLNTPWWASSRISTHVTQSSSQKSGQLLPVIVFTSAWHTTVLSQWSCEHSLLAAQNYNIMASKTQGVIDGCAEDKLKAITR